MELEDFVKGVMDGSIPVRQRTNDDDALGTSLAPLPSPEPEDIAAEAFARDVLDVELVEWDFAVARIAALMEAL